MGTKYIIEVEDKPFELLSEDGFTSEKLFRVKGFNSLVFDWNGLNMLMPYTEPNLERVKKEAYDKGYHDGYFVGDESWKDIVHEKEEEFYQKGLSDAWEAARKLWEIDISTLHKIFYKETRMDCYMYYTATDVVAKIKEYEDKQEEIKIGNEVNAFEKKPFIVTGFGYGDNEEDVYCYGFVTENGISTSAKKNSCVRTGRHFPEIAAIFEKMRNEPNAQIDT